MLGTTLSAMFGEVERRAERAKTIHLGDPFRQAHAQGLRDPPEVDDADIALAPLDATL